MCRIALWITVCLFATLVGPLSALAEEFQCPTGALVHGEPPPEGLKAWCELPDGTQHGPSLFQAGIQVGPKTTHQAQHNGIVIKDVGDEDDGQGVLQVQRWMLQVE